MLSPLFTPDTIEYMNHDPLGPRRFLIAIQRDQIVGTAMVTKTEMIQQDGRLQRFSNLSHVRVRGESTDALSALIAAVGTPVVTLPNVSALAPAMLKAARVRATPSCFTAYLAGGPPDIRATEFEVV